MRRTTRRLLTTLSLAAVAASMAAAPSHAEIVFSVDTANILRSFDSATPGTLLPGYPIGVTDLQPGETLHGIDFRPANGQLYALGSTSRLYTLNPATGAATQVGTGPFTPALSGAGFGFDFNPAVDRIRVTSDTEQSFILHPDTGQATTSTALNPTGSDITAVAYVNNQPGAAVTTLYGIDAGPDPDRLVKIGGDEGVPSPNTGTYTVVGSTAVSSSNANTSFDISPSGGAYVAASGGGTASFGTIDLRSGEVTGLTAMNGAEVRGMAVRGTVTVHRFGATGFGAGEAAGTATITVQRLNNVTVPSSVTYATSDGTATAGSDYTATSGTLSFAAGESSQSFAVPIADDSATEGPEIVNLSLGGTSASATLTIFDNEGGTPPASPPTPASPAASLTAPAAGRRLTAGRRATVSATATAGRAIRGIAFLADDRVICTDTAAPYSCGYTPNAEDIGRVNLAAIATDEGGQSASAQRSHVVNRYVPVSLSSVTTPARDRIAPFRFTTTGRLRLPAGLTAAQGCGPRGRVEVTYESGRLKTIVSATLSPTCTYRTQAVLLTRIGLPGSGRIKITARYQGNTRLATRTAPARTVRAG